MTTFRIHPKKLCLLLAKLEEGFDVVYGTPDKEQHGVLRNMASRITKLTLASAMGAESARKVSAFRAFRTSLRDGFEHYRGPFVSIDVLLTWGTTRFVGDPCPARCPIPGRLKLYAAKASGSRRQHDDGIYVAALANRQLDRIRLHSFRTCASDFRARSTYWMGVLRYQGFPFLASVISIFSGAQLFALGVIGEYLARMHFRMMEQPPFVVRESTEAPIKQEAMGEKTGKHAAGVRGS